VIERFPGLTEIKISPLLNLDNRVLVDKNIKGRHPPMPTKDNFASDHPLPLFFSGHADEHEERGSLLLLEGRGSLLLLNASILGLVASLVAMAIILLWGNPVKVFADITASLTNISALQPSSDQSKPTIPSAPTVQSAADAQAVPPTASGAATRNEVAAASEPADQGQKEISEPTSGALFRQFQAWAAERAQVKSAQPVQDAPAQVVQDAPPPVRPMEKHRMARSVQNARAEMRHVQKPRAKVRRE
jgi:hypothetical protein